MVEAQRYVRDVIKQVEIDADDAHSEKDAGDSWKKRCAAAVAEVYNKDASKQYQQDPPCSRPWLPRGRSYAEESDPAHQQSNEEVENVSEELNEASSSSDPLEGNWVMVERPAGEELQLVPFMEDSEPQTFGSVAKAGALGGAAGLLFFGPAGGIVVAAGAVRAYAEPGTLSKSAQDAVRWVSRNSPIAIDDGSQTYDKLIVRAKTMLGDTQRIPEKLSPALASIFEFFSGDALKERDMLIQRLQFELEASSHESAAEKARAEELQNAEHQWREQSTQISKELQAANLAKAEEVAKLKTDLMTTEQTWQEDCAKLSLELEHHRRERLAENKRLSSELADAAIKRAADLAKFQETLDELEQAQLAQAEELEAKERTEAELEAARRVNAEEMELKRCCICLESDRQVLFLPCRHICCCATCSETIRECPMDRGHIQQRITFIMS